MPPNLGGFLMDRSYYPSECNADYFDFERIEALKPDFEASGICTLSQSPLLVFHKQMDNRIQLFEDILSLRMQGVECDNGDMYVDGHEAASDVLVFFQAEDGIRDIGVTGVQTCALPICDNRVRLGVHFGGASDAGDAAAGGWATDQRFELPRDVAPGGSVTLTVGVKAPAAVRSEERRVGEEGRSRWSPAA